MAAYTHRHLFILVTGKSASKTMRETVPKIGIKLFSWRGALLCVTALLGRSVLTQLAPGNQQEQAR